MSNFNCETIIKKSRVQRQCRACFSMIPPGSKVVRWSGVYDGHFNRDWFHPECSEAEKDYNSVHGSSTNSFDERDPLVEMKWLVNEHPIAAERLEIEPLLARMQLED